MANTKQTKKYLGGWDTSAYDDVSKASRQAYETNWDALKNRFNAIMEESERQQQLAEKEYANTLASQASANLRTQRAIDQDLTNRGIINSGVRAGLIEDATAQTGAKVDDAISKLMSTTKASGETRLNALNNLVAGGNELNANQLEDQLGILKAKQADDMQGQQLAADLANQAAARAASSGSGDSDEEYNEELRKLSVWAILNNIDPETGEELNMTDAQKTFVLANYYDVKDAKDSVKGFNPIINYDTSYLEDDTTLSEYKKLQNKQRKLNKAETNLNNALRYKGDDRVEGRTKKLQEAKKQYAEALAEYQATDYYKERQNMATLADMPIRDYYNMVYNKS